MSSIENIRKMSREEREKRLQELRAELARLKAQAHRGSLENPSSIRKIKREIARILTVMNEEKLGKSKSQVAATAEKQ
ncbi:50S ribosomal protein L29 [Thermofilum sp.]|jgi:large subunit ribosomal protein L29|uniref:50S ribosomal protein L29 n=1 Tax=Thermofilum sp. TaxID=1961369 RepID=UPI00258A107C|nr:50S ribosomal protein L29 [Thermofilum sp.]